MQGFRLRPYQQRGSDRVLKEFGEVNSTLVVWPTGTGKTVLFADVIRRMQPQRALVLAHRKQLILQARERIEATTGLRCEIEMGELSVAPGLFGNSPVVISTVQTQISQCGDMKRMGKFPHTNFGLLILDEAHRTASRSYLDVIAYYRQNPDLRILGVTATPDRHDEKALGKIFETVADDYELLDAIHDGWLVNILQKCVYIHGLDYSHVKTTAGDLNSSDLSEVMEAEEVSQRVIQASLECMYGVPQESLNDLPIEKWPNYLNTNGKPKRTLVFTVSVKQAQIMSDIFNRVLPGSAAWVCGMTPDDQRASVLADFHTGVFNVVCNCDLFGEGYDHPGIECVIMARATKSRAKYCQQVGRGTRPLPGVVDGIDSAEDRIKAISASAKKNLLVVDFVGNSGRHKLMTSADILSGNMQEEVIARAVKIAQKSKVALVMSEVLEDEEEKLEREIEERRKADAARKARLVAKVRYTSKFINPFDVFEMHPAVDRGWHDGKILSEKQKNVLRAQGIDPDSLTYAQGKQLIGEIFRRWQGKLCSLKQANILKKRNLPVDVSWEKAKQMIDEIAKKEGWKVR